MWTAKNRQQHERQGLRYPSDVTDEEWNVVRPYLVAEGGKCSPTPERMREILNGVLYVLSTGCQWRAVPKDLPPRSTLHGWLRENIYRHGSKFTAPEIVERASGTPLTIEPYINYLKTKYGALYTL